MKKIRMFALIVLFFPMLGFASNIPTGYPTQLIHHGEPMSPLLFCPFASDTSPKPIESNQDLTAQGYIGSSYKLTADGAAFQGESYYKIVAEANGYFIISSICNLNGETTLSSLYQVTPVMGDLKIKAIYGGDNTDGGIVNVIQQNNQLLYQVSLTKSHFFSLTHMNPAQFKNSRNGACEDCVFADATFSRNLTPALGAQQLVAITIDKPIKQVTDTCFNDIASLSSRNEKIVLTPSDLSTFSQHVNMCLSMQATLGASLTHWLLGILPPSFWASNGITTAMTSKVTSSS